jgi:hypothetical protein
MRLGDCDPEARSGAHEDDGVWAMLNPVLPARVGWALDVRQECRTYPFPLSTAWEWSITRRVIATVRRVLGARGWTVI